MISAHDYRELVSGRRRGVMASLARAALSAAELPYSLAVDYRNRRYDHGHCETHAVDVPVISVGNLTLGGTGKTPMVQYLATWFQQRNIRVSIISRGYRAVDGEANDEARELAEKLPSVPHLQNPDRVLAATRALVEFKSQVILLDDGFQHRRLRRDLDVVLVDALEPFGFDHVFPRGMLREPLRGLSRANIVGLSRADLVAVEQREIVRHRVAELNPDAIWLELAHQPCGLRGRGGREDVELINGRNVVAFCGIGNPQAFRHTLQRCAARVSAFREFPDHHCYSPNDIESLADWVQSHRPEMVICTHKDLVKIDVDRLGDTPLRALEVELQVLRGRQELDQQLLTLTDCSERR